MAFHRTITGLVFAACLAMPPAHAASTTNFSDQWWNPAESGWGASVLQQWDTLFIDLFVYGGDAKPTWFVAAVTAQAGAPAGHTVFTGDLYVTTGPYFGGVFDPAAVGGRKAGTLTFDANSSTTALISYTVDGTPVAKNVTRQTWKLENIAGSHFGGAVIDTVACTNPEDNSHVEFPATINVTQTADNHVTLNFAVDDSGSGCALSGTYSQLGHTGIVADAVDGCSASGQQLYVYELERSVNGLTGRWAAVNPPPPDGNGCQIAGRFGGVRR